MDDLRKIAYCLTAAGGAASQEGFHLLYEEDNNLVEKLWNTTEVVQDSIVGKDVKTNASAAYILVAGEDENTPDKRLAFSIGKNGFLRCFAYDAEYLEWDDEDLGRAASVKIQPGSGLAADSGPDGVTLFFQNERGKLQSLVLGTNGWEIGEELPASPRADTALSTVETDKEFRLFYLASDNVMHYLAKSYEGGSWTDYAWDTVQVSSPISRFKVAYEPDSTKLEAHILTEGNLIRFAGTEKGVNLGTVKGGDLTPTNLAQSTRHTYMSGFVIENGRLVGVNHYHRRTHYHKNGSYHSRSSTRFWPV